jgi:asparagine synthase (glutamine-hydrolysing)
LRDALARLPSGPPKVLLFSGGVDSGLLAWELRTEARLTLVTVGLQGCADLAAGELAARELGLSWEPKTFRDVDALEMDRTIAPETRGLPPTARSVDVAFALAVRYAPPGLLLCGQGADELFLGYAHFHGLSEQAAGQRAVEDLGYLLREAWPRAQRIATTLGREVVAPYLDPEFRSVAESIPLPERLAGPEPKGAFRAFARRQGLPEPIASRPKKALQYGTGVDRLLRRSRARAPESV